MKRGFFNDVIHFHFLLDFIHKKVHIKYVIRSLLVILTPKMPLFWDLILTEATFYIQHSRTWKIWRTGLDLLKCSSKNAPRDPDVWALSQHLMVLCFSVSWGWECAEPSRPLAPTTSKIMRSTWSKFSKLWVITAFKETPHSFWQLIPHSALLSLTWSMQKLLPSFFPVILCSKHHFGGVGVCVSACVCGGVTLHRFQLFSTPLIQFVYCNSDT